MEDWDRTHVASQARIQAHQAARLGLLRKVDADRIAKESKQQHLMNTQVKEAARLTKHTQVIGRIQQLFQSSHGRSREVMRHLRKKGTN